MRGIFATDRATAVVFFGTLLAIALMTKTMPESAHEFSRLGTVESLVDRGTFQLDDSSFIATLDKIYRDGHYYSHQPPLLSVLEAPVYWTLSLPGMKFNNRARAVMTYLFSLLTNGLALALTAVALQRILGLAGVAPPARDAFAVMLPMATWLLPYGLVINSHGIAALLLAVAVLLLLTIERRGATPARLAALGLVLGALVAIEILPLVSFLPVAIAALAWRVRITARGWLAFGTALAVPLVAHAAANVRVTGDIIPAGFHHELFRYPGSVFDERELTGTVKYDSWSAAARYAWQSFVAGKGYFTFAPILAAGLIAGILEWRWWARARGTHAVLLVGSLLSLAVSVATTNNFGGEAVGFRHATYVVPALLVLLLPWIAGAVPAASLKRRVVIAAAVISLASMVVFASPRPWSVLTVDNPRPGALADYAPMVTRVATGEVLVR